MPTYICGIDPGTHNLAVSIIDAKTKEIVYLNNENLFLEHIPGKGEVQWEFDPKLIPLYLEKYYATNKLIFSKVSLCVVEHQLTERMQRVAFGLEALFSQYGRAVTIHPSTIKAWAGTRKGEYAKNKRAAVAWCNHNLAGVNLDRFREFERKGVKSDDVADALMLALYASAHYEELSKVVLVEKGLHKKKKQRRKKPNQK